MNVEQAFHAVELRIVEDALRQLADTRERIHAELCEALLLGPSPAPVARVNYTYRYRLTLSCKNNRQIRALLSFLLGAFAKDKQNKGVSAFVDVNAYD